MEWNLFLKEMKPELVYFFVYFFRNIWKLGEPQRISAKENEKNVTKKNIDLLIISRALF